MAGHKDVPLAAMTAATAARSAATNRMHVKPSEEGMVAGSVLFARNRRASTATMEVAKLENCNCVSFCVCASTAVGAAAATTRREAS